MRYFLLLGLLGLSACSWSTAPGERCQFVEGATLYNGTVTDSAVVATIGRGDGSGRDTVWAHVCTFAPTP